MTIEKDLGNSYFYAGPSMTKPDTVSVVFLAWNHVESITGKKSAVSNEYADAFLIYFERGKWPRFIRHKMDYKNFNQMLHK